MWADSRQSIALALPWIVAVVSPLSYIVLILIILSDPMSSTYGELPFYVTNASAVTASIYKSQVFFVTFRLFMNNITFLGNYLQFSNGVNGVVYINECHFQSPGIV
jgi:hypothetical protein